MTLYDSSLHIIQAGQSVTGAYVASPTFSQYGYSWLRDGAWIAYGMDCAGQHASASAFYNWVGHTLTQHHDRLEKLLAKITQGETPDEHDYLPTRFTLDGAIDHEIFWQNFQLDGYGTWLWTLAAHLQMTHADLPDSLRPAVEMSLRYIAALWQSPNYDCWEEHREQIHLSTLAALYGGVNAAQTFAPSLVPPGLPEKISQFALERGLAPDGHFMKFLGNHEVDASLLWLAVPYNLVEVSDPRFLKTLAKIEQDLLKSGVYRYQADTYYGGGEWILLTAWLGWAYVKLGRIDEARQLLRWIEAQATPNGELPEQVATHVLDVSYLPHWETRWGTSACPLLWSHAMYLVLKTRLDIVP